MCRFRFIKVDLADAFRISTKAGDADPIVGRCKNAFHFSPPALPTTARPFSDLPSLRRGFVRVVIHCRLNPCAGCDCEIGKIPPSEGPKDVSNKAPSSSAGFCLIWDGMF